MNLTTLSDEIGRLLSDVTHDRWSQSTLTTRINLAQTEIQGATKAVKTIESSISTTSPVTLNANTMDIMRVILVNSDGSTKELTGITLEELIYLYPDFGSWGMGEPLFYLYDATTQSLNFEPSPSSSWPTVTVSEIRKPSDLSASTDIPFDSNNQMIPYHLSIVHWVVAQCFMDDGTPESLAKAKFHKSGSMLRPGEYEKQLGRIMAEFDTPTNIPSHILYKPTGGRINGWVGPSKASPLGW